METVQLASGQTVKLGRIKPKVKPNVVQLGPYIKDAPTPPESVDYTAKAKSAIARMYLNDTYGDCVMASSYHAIGLWSGNETDIPVVATDQEVYTSYQTVCGRGDNGCVITEVLDYAKNKGLIAAGIPHKIDDYVAIDWANKVEVQMAILLFGAVKVGVDLPNAWVNSPDIWDVTNTRIVGGHDILAVSYNSVGVIVCTWGGLRTITWAAFLSKNWVDECYALLSPDWYAKANLSPSGLDAAGLKADLALLNSGSIPPLPNPNPLPPVPPDPNPPIPTPPTPIPPTPVGPALADVISAIENAVEENRPYGWFTAGVVNSVEQDAIAAVKAVWAKSGHK